jgi:hypothetical protein
VGPVEIENRIAAIPLIIADMNEIMPRYRVQKRANAFTDGLVYRAASARNQQQSHEYSRQWPGETGKKKSGCHCCALFILSRVVPIITTAIPRN